VSGSGPSRAHKGEISPELLGLTALSGAEVLQRLRTSERGLSAAEVERRREEYGANRVTHEERETLVGRQRFNS
jgi:magnesium-transporting ATPase (P-type)